MTPRRKRMLLVAMIVVGVGLAVGFGLKAFNENLLYYFTPTQVAKGEAKGVKRFRMGGMVVKGSIKRQPGSMTVHFTLTDARHDIPVVYTGILPDLFRDGQGVVVHGSIASNGLFTADQVLAKHDAKYMPPEIAKSIKQARKREAAREKSLASSPSS